MVLRLELAQGAFRSLRNFRRLRRIAGLVFTLKLLLRTGLFDGARIAPRALRLRAC
jgi:hypothetical protein